MQGFLYAFVFTRQDSSLLSTRMRCAVRQPLFICIFLHSPFSHKSFVAAITPRNVEKCPREIHRESKHRMDTDRLSRNRARSNLEKYSRKIDDAQNEYLSAQ